MRKATHTLLHGDARALPLADRSVHVAITSIPYFGQRVYDETDPSEIGREETIPEYVRAILTLADEVHRVLRDDGIFFLNVGDSHYNYRTGHNGGVPGQSIHRGEQRGKPTKAQGCARRARRHPGLKEKDLIMIPHRIALALQGSAVVPYEWIGRRRLNDRGFTVI